MLSTEESINDNKLWVTIILEKEDLNLSFEDIEKLLSWVRINKIYLKEDFDSKPVLEKIHKLFWFMVTLKTKFFGVFEGDINNCEKMKEHKTK